MTRALERREELTSPMTNRVQQGGRKGPLALPRSPSSARQTELLKERRLVVVPALLCDEVRPIDTPNCHELGFDALVRRRDLSRRRLQRALMRPSPRAFHHELVTISDHVGDLKLHVR